MTASHFSGPLMVYGTPPAGSSAGGNPEAGPSGFYQGVATLDPRFSYQPGITGLGKLPAFANSPYIWIVNATPAAKAVANIAAAANVVSGTPMTLVSSSGSGIVVGASVYDVTANAVRSGVTALAIEQAYTPLTVGPLALFDPTKAVTRAASVTGSSSATGGDFLFRGYDLYGQAMSETITAASGVATTNGKKAFKYITSVTPQFTDAHNYSVGTTDIFGFALRSDLWEQMDACFNGAFLTASTGYTAAVTTTATATTGDTRGTYATQSATDGSKRLMIAITLSPNAAATATTASSTSLFGVAQA
ncbi:hypothetical protein ABNQ39_00160 (plasmid) [Azospirillum sp. A26]|uniref:hypothetical protein n=1 Tax=Azospirillum sp. A26 TaxID=3160607 RepID=UPI00366A5B07